MTMYAGDEYYGDEITSGPDPDDLREHIDLERKAERERIELLPDEVTVKGPWYAL